MRHLADPEREAFQRDGYVVVERALDPTRLELLWRVVGEAIEARDRQRRARPDELAEMCAAEARGEVVHPTTELHVIEHMYQLWERFPLAKRHSLDAELAGLARDALEADALRLWFDQVMIKEPQGGPTPFHQDNAYAPLDDSLGGCVTIWTALADADDEMGTLRYLPGTHRGPRLDPVPLAAVDSIAPLLPEPGMLADARPTRLAAGDLLLHHGTVIHGAGPNRTDRPRPAFITCYFTDGTRRRQGLPHFVLDREGVPDGEPLRGATIPVVTTDREVQPP